MTRSEKKDVFKKERHDHGAKENITERKHT